MANFRCERVLVMLDDPVPGLDHLRAVDPVKLADLFSETLDNHAMDAGLTPLTDFLFAPFDRPRWKPALKGLQTVQGLIALYQQWQSAGIDPFSAGGTPRWAQDLEVLSQLEAVLDAADTRDRKFYFAARDLE